MLGFLVIQSVLIATDTPGGIDYSREGTGVIVSRVSRAMGEKRWTISDLARAADISRTTAAKLYHGGTDVNLSVVDRVCRALGAELCELFEYVPDGGGESETREGGGAGAGGGGG